MTTMGWMSRRFLRVAGIAALIALFAASVGAIDMAAPGMPDGTDFGLDRREQPRQVLGAEAAGGRQSYMVALGNTAFSSPLLFGAKAREAGLSCDTCHTNGDVNQRFFIPGVSVRHGGLDPTTAFFNPVQDDGVQNHVDIPSLRGIRYLGPYGRDGRIGSLREFTRHVIVNEFAGPEPDPRILDALVAYMDQFEFLPNLRLDTLGRLTGTVSAAERRGEALFAKPLAAMGGKSCASCHVPDALFTDGRRHDVGSGGVFKTPTLLNVDFTAPYFHDGRYDTIEAAIDHFDRTFALKLSRAEKADLAAYVRAVGDGEGPFEPVTRQSEMSEVASYVAALDRAIATGDRPAAVLIADTVNFDLARIARRFDNRNPATGLARRPDRPDVAKIAAQLIEDMTQVKAEAEAGRAQEAKVALEAYRGHAKLLVSAYPGTSASP